MKSLWIVAVLVCVVLASGVWAQGAAALSPRAAGMGGVGIGVADDAAAWFQNPAGLAALNLKSINESEYANDALVAFGQNGDDNAWELTWSGWKPADSIGFGAGYFNLDNEGSIFGAGFGAGFKTVPLSFGVSLMGLNPDDDDYEMTPGQFGGFGGGDDQTILNLGAMYRFSQGEGKSPIRVGLTVMDITDQLNNDGAIWSAGIGWKPIEDLLVAVDVNDFTTQVGDCTISGGVEYAFGPQKEWRGRAGLIAAGDDDHELTLGLGYVSNRWRADFAWINTDPDNTWSLGVGVNL